MSSNSNPNQVIAIPTTSSPASGSSATPSSASSSTSDTSDQVTNRQLLDTSRSKRKRYAKERVKSCREKTLESEICKTINKYMSKCLNDDKCRRMTAIAIMILAVVGLYHIFISLF